MKKMILASASPRRKELMKQAGFEFDIEVSDKEEELNIDDPEETVLKLSLVKAMDVASRHPEEVVVIGADTVVACDHKILGKPHSEEEAFDMLKMLQGRTHQVYTGVAILSGPSEDRKVCSFAECTQVTMYPVSDEAIRAYIRTGEPMDKAGAYGIQGRAGVFIRGIEGDYNNVVGLPIAAIWQYVCCNVTPAREEKDVTL